MSGFYTDNYGVFADFMTKHLLAFTPPLLRSLFFGLSLQVVIFINVQIIGHVVRFTRQDKFTFRLLYIYIEYIIGTFHRLQTARDKLERCLLSPRIPQPLSRQLLEGCLRSCGAFAPGQTLRRRAVRRKRMDADFGLRTDISANPRHCVVLCCVRCVML